MSVWCKAVEAVDTPPLPSPVDASHILEAVAMRADIVFSLFGGQECVGWLTFVSKLSLLVSQVAELSEPDVQQVVPEKDWVVDSCFSFLSGCLLNCYLQAPSEARLS